MFEALFISWNGGLTVRLGHLVEARGSGQGFDERKK